MRKKSREKIHNTNKMNLQGQCLSCDGMLVSISKHHRENRLHQGIPSLFFPIVAPIGWALIASIVSRSQDPFLLRRLSRPPQCTDHELMRHAERCAGNGLLLETEQKGRRGKGDYFSAWLGPVGHGIEINCNAK
jgi:hypothetical protein